MSPGPTLRLLVVALVVGLVTSAAAVSLAAPGPGDWSQTRYGPGLTAYNPQASGPTDDVGPTWVSRADGVGVDVSMVSGDGRLYVAVHEGRAYAFDLETGRQVWHAPLGEATTNSPSAVGDVLVVPVGTTDARWTLVGVDAATGEERWTYDPPTDRPHSWSDSDVVVAGDLVLVSGAFSGPDAPGEPFVAAVDPATGEEAWRTALPETYADHLVSTPAVLDGTAFVLARTYDDAPVAHVLAFDATDGTLAWNTSVPVAAETVLAADGTVFAAGTGVVALDPDTGELRGTVVEDTYRFAPPAYAGGTLFVLRTEGGDPFDPRSVVAVDAATGEERWTATVEAGDWIETYPVVTDRYVLVGTVMGDLVAVDRETGETVWSYTVDERLGLDTPPVPVGETVYVVTSRVYALAEGGEAVPGGTLGRVGTLLRENAVLGFAAMGLGAGLTTGLLAGLVSLATVELLGLSRAPQRVLAARLFGGPPTEVRPGERYAAHLLASVGLALAVGSLAAVGWLVVPLLAALVASAVPVVVPGLALLSVPLALLLVGVVVGTFWWVLAYRWLPAEESVLDEPLGVVRRDWALLHAAYGLVLVAAFPFVAFVFALVIFQPF
jgi:outer membrane protein assembly factor BamB